MGMRGKGLAWWWWCRCPRPGVLYGVEIEYCCCCYDDDGRVEQGISQRHSMPLDLDQINRNGEVSAK